jgi:hypothetical protein
MEKKMHVAYVNVHKIGCASGRQEQVNNHSFTNLLGFEPFLIAQNRIMPKQAFS